MHWISRGTAGLLLVLLTGALLLLAGNLWMIFKMRDRVFSEVDQLGRHRTGLVLGTSPRSEFLEQRLQAGAKLYHTGKVDRLLVTGDSHGRHYDEVGYMENRLIELGVPVGRIEADPYGLRTLDSIARAKRIYHLESITVVTQRFHTYRALYLAERFGLDAEAYAAGDAPWRDRLFVHTREWFARTVALIDVHILSREPRYNGSSDTGASDTQDGHRKK